MDRVPGLCRPSVPCAILSTQDWDRREGGRKRHPGGEIRFLSSPSIPPASPSHWRAGGREGRSHGSLVIFPHRSHRETGGRPRRGEAVKLQVQISRRGERDPFEGTHLQSLDMARKACNDRSIELIYAGTDITYDEVDRKEQIGASGARRVGEGRPVRSYSEGLSPSHSLSGCLPSSPPTTHPPLTRCWWATTRQPPASDRQTRPSRCRIRPLNYLVSRRKWPMRNGKEGREGREAGEYDCSQICSPL